MPRPPSPSWSGHEPHHEFTPTTQPAQLSDEKTQSTRDNRQHQVQPTHHILHLLRRPLPTMQVHKPNAAQPHDAPQHGSLVMLIISATVKQDHASSKCGQPSDWSVSSPRQDLCPTIHVGTLHPACESPSTNSVYERDLTSHCIMPGHSLSAVTE
jgi:hypothetical protein